MSEKTPTQQVSEWLAALGRALELGDGAGAATLFGNDSYWRDLVSFTWNITTAEGNAKVRQMIEHAVIPAKPSGWRLEGKASERGGVTEGWIRFETVVARGYGHLRLSGGKAWTLLTTMTELRGYEEHQGPTRDKGVEHGVHPGRKTWLELRRQEEAELGITTQPYVVIVGGGQGGIALGARLRRLNVPAIIVEKNERPGDSWRKRYKSLCLHDPVWYDHLPYLPFPEHWPVFSSKDKIADWLEMYTKVMELNYWGSTECQSARFDEGKREWSVEVVRTGRPVTLRSGGDRLRQLGARHLRRTVGRRRRCDDGAAQFDACRAQRDPDGIGPQRHVLRSRSEGRRHHREGRYDRRLTAV